MLTKLLLLNLFVAFINTAISHIFCLFDDASSGYYFARIPFSAKVSTLFFYFLLSLVPMVNLIQLAGSIRLAYRKYGDK